MPRIHPRLKSSGFIRIVGIKTISDWSVKWRYQNQNLWLISDDKSFNSERESGNISINVRNIWIL